MAKTVNRIWNHNLDVVGLGHRWKRDGRRALSDMIDKRGSITGIKIEREFENPADDNAIHVFLPDRILNGAKLGYLRREAAALLAPKIDAGTLQVVRASLLELRADDDWKEGVLHVVFRDIAAKSGSAKGKKSS